MVCLRGSPAFVERLKDLLTAAANELRARVVLALAVPASLHGAVGGERVKDLKQLYGVIIEVGGRTSPPDQGGLDSSPGNMDDVRDAEPGDVITVSGSREGCEQAIAEIRVSIIYSMSHLR